MTFIEECLEVLLVIVVFEYFYIYFFIFPIYNIQLSKYHLFSKCYIKMHIKLKDCNLMAAVTLVKDISEAKKNKRKMGHHCTTCNTNDTIM